MNKYISVNYNECMINEFDEFEKSFSEKIQDEPVTRKLYQCPYCKEHLPGAYLEQNPFPEIPCTACGALISVSSLVEVEMTAPDQRADKRCPATLKVTHESFNEFITEYTKNVSRGGMFIRTKRQYDIGSTVELKLSVPGLEDPIRLKAEVVRIQQRTAQEEDAGVGVKFIDIEDESREALVAFLKSQADCL